MPKISIIGLGFVGNAMYQSFKNKIESLNLSDKYTLYGYDKYKNGGIGNLNDCLNSDIIFTALPTLYNEQLKSYDNSSSYEVINELYLNEYTKTIVIKSTVEPNFTETLAIKYPEISFIHNPEFLTARTAYSDFHNQKHIILGKSNSCNDASFELVKEFYRDLYSQNTDFVISECKASESESVKIFCNSFYASKIQILTEFYLLCNKLNLNYNLIMEMMLKNGWINKMHTQIPGPDGNISFGGMCFPKDVNALYQFMKSHNVPCEMMRACIEERNSMRD